MGFRVQKRLRMAKGVHLNISKKGIGISAGVPGFRVSMGPRGVRRTVGIPGTGLSYSRYENKSRSRCKSTMSGDLQIQQMLTAWENGDPNPYFDRMFDAYCLEKGIPPQAYPSGCTVQDGMILIGVAIDDPEAMREYRKSERFFRRDSFRTGIFLLIYYAAFAALIFHVFFGGFNAR